MIVTSPDRVRNELENNFSVKEFKEKMNKRVKSTKNPLKFDERFYEKILNGKKRLTFRRDTSRNLWDCFTISGHYYEITAKIPTTLEYFIRENYLDDGFESEEEAREYFRKLYFSNPDGKSPNLGIDCDVPNYRECYGDNCDFNEVEGMIFKFEEVVK